MFNIIWHTFWKEIFYVNILQIFNNFFKETELNISRNTHAVLIKCTHVFTISHVIIIYSLDVFAVLTWSGLCNWFFFFSICWRPSIEFLNRYTNCTVLLSHLYFHNNSSCIFTSYSSKRLKSQGMGNL